MLWRSRDPVQSSYAGSPVLAILLFDTNGEAPEHPSLSRVVCTVACELWRVDDPDMIAEDTGARITSGVDRLDEQVFASADTSPREVMTGRGRCGLDGAVGVNWCAGVVADASAVWPDEVGRRPGSIDAQSAESPSDARKCILLLHPDSLSSSSFPSIARAKVHRTIHKSSSGNGERMVL
jgi:hypothetical protein